VKTIDQSRSSRYGLSVSKICKTRATLLCAGAALLLLLSGCATAPDAARNQFAAQFPEERPFPDSRFMSISSVRIHYRVWAPPQTAIGKVLLLPTEGGSTATWRFLAERLAQAGYAVLAADLPAFGFSDLAMDFEHTFDARAGLFWSLADRIDTETNNFSPTRGWNVMGHGVGGQVAVIMAGQRPQRTENLVLVGSEVDREANPSRFMWFPPVRWTLRAWINESLYTEEGVRELLSDAYGRVANDAEVAMYAAPLLRPGMTNSFINYRRTAGQIEFLLEELQPRTLLLSGELDENIDPESLDRAADRVPEATRIVIEGAAHIPMETHAEITAEAILSWLSAGSSAE
jgi:pimeloyl-ACP methyl ester carboxylesterase